MLMSSADFADRRKLYAKAAKRRFCISILALLAYFACLCWIAERWFFGVAETSGVWGVLVSAVPMFVGGAGWMWYSSRSLAALQRKHGLMCPSCHAFLEWQIGKPRIANGKCMKCGSQIVDSVT